MILRRFVRPSAIIGSFVLAIGALLYFYYNSPQSIPHVFHSGFETGDLSEWNWPGARQLCCAHSATVLPGGNGSGHVVRVELRVDDPKERGSVRGEFRLWPARFGATYTYSASLLLPKDWAADSVPVTLLQWHNVPDRFLLEAGTAPPLRLAALDDWLYVVSVWDHRRVSRFSGQDITTDGHQIVAKVPIPRGHWMNWRFRVRWSMGDDGLVEVYLDDRLIGVRHGPNAINDIVGPYYKFGIYVPGWGDKKATSVRKRIAYFDNIDETAAP